MKTGASSATRFHVINKCGVDAVFETAILAALNGMPDHMKLLDRPVYAILVGRCSLTLSMLVELSCAGDGGA